MSADTSIPAFGAALIPEPSLRRLPWYLAYVTLLRQQGVDFVSSTQIARQLNVDPSLTSKDLSYLGLHGKTRIGYEVARLEHELEAFLGFRRQHRAVLLGVGSLGRALMLDTGLSSYGLQIVAGFDVDPRLVGSRPYGLPVYHIEELEWRLPQLQASIGIICVPPAAAQATADTLVKLGIAAIWNFTPYRISVPDNIVVTNTSIYAHLALMYNRMGK